MRLHKRFDMMTTKRLYLLLLGFALMGMKAQAQHVSFGPLHSQDSPREDWLLPGDTVYQDEKTIVYGGKPVKNTQDSDYYNNPISNLVNSGGLGNSYDYWGNDWGK